MLPVQSHFRFFVLCCLATCCVVFANRGRPPETARPHSDIDQPPVKGSKPQSEDAKPNCENPAVKLWGDGERATHGQLPKTWGQIAIGGDLALKSMADYRGSTKKVAVSALSRGFYVEHVDDSKMDKKDIENLSAIFHNERPEVLDRALGTGLANLIHKKNREGLPIGLGPNVEFDHLSGAGFDAGQFLERVKSAKSKMVLYDRHPFKKVLKDLMSDDRIVLTSAKGRPTDNLDESLVDFQDATPPLIVVGGISPLGFADGQTSDVGPDEITVSAPGPGVYSFNGTVPTTEPIRAWNNEDAPEGPIDQEGIRYQFRNYDPVLRPQPSTVSATALTLGALSNVVSIVPDLTAAEAKTLLKKTALPGPGTNILNALKLVEVGKRLAGKTKEERKALLAGTSDAKGLFDFKAEAEAALTTAERLQKDCPAESAAFFRKAFFLDPKSKSGEKALAALVDYYLSPKVDLKEMAQYFADFNPASRLKTIEAQYDNGRWRGDLSKSAARGLSSLPEPKNDAEREAYVKLGAKLLKGSGAAPAAKFLGTLGEPGKEALLEGLREGYVDAARELGDDARSEVEQIYINKEAGKFDKLFSVLPDLGKLGLDYLERGANDSDLYTRRLAFAQMGRIPAKDAGRILQKTFASKQFALGDEEAQALKYFSYSHGDSPEALAMVDTLLKNATEDRDHETRPVKLTVTALETLSRMPKDNVDKIFKKYGDRIYDFYAFGRKDDNFLDSELRKNHEQIRAALLRAVPHLTAKGMNDYGLPLLKKALKEDDPNLIREALVSAREVGGATLREIFTMASESKSRDVSRHLLYEMGDANLENGKVVIPILKKVALDIRKSYANALEDDKQKYDGPSLEQLRERDRVKHVAELVEKLNGKQIPMRDLGPEVRQMVKDQFKIESDDALKKTLPYLFMGPEK